MPITLASSWTQGIPSLSGHSLGKNFVCKMPQLRKPASLIAFSHSSTYISLLFHLVAQNQIQTNSQSSSYCHIPIWLLYFFNFLIRIFTNAFPCLTSLLIPVTFTIISPVPLLQNHNRKPSYRWKDACSLLTYFTNAFIHSVLNFTSDCLSLWSKTESLLLLVDSRF